MEKVVYFIISLPRNILILLIRIYQKLFSFDHAFWANPSVFRICMYEPSCSEYTVQALERHGFFKGIIMGTARIIRCNPLAKGGYDPVTDKFTIFSSNRKNL